MCTAVCTCGMYVNECRGVKNKYYMMPSFFFLQRDFDLFTYSSFFLLGGGVGDDDESSRVESNPRRK